LRSCPTESARHGGATDAKRKHFNLASTSGNSNSWSSSITDHLIALGHPKFCLPIQYVEFDCFFSSLGSFSPSSMPRTQSGDNLNTNSEKDHLSGELNCPRSDGLASLAKLQIKVPVNFPLRSTLRPHFINISLSSNKYFVNF